MRIGIFGGTFNPPHKGHVRIVEKMTEEMNLDKVLIIPNKKPTHKRCDDLADNQHRLEMCKMAFHNPIYEVSSIEMDRDSDSYTIYTLNELAEMYPDDEFFLIIGSDMFLIFNKWYKHKELLERCTLCVASRDNDDTIRQLRAYAFDTLGIYIKELDGKHIHISPMSAYEVSSSDIRARIAEGKSIYGMTDPEIIEYMEKNKLYGYGKKR
ncbi:MAG: nicotinate (nicotinamide) nucleotide adenylyltransferase [Clostridiales bacterium]|nr:nicotinate (nicotinamide) nucleotide adenylyltransferase [Clostridiales bacterium]